MLGIAIILISGFIYISLTTSYVREIYGCRDRVVIGSQYVDQGMADFVASNPSKYSPAELVKQFHDVEKVWSRGSLTENRRHLLVSWCFCWIGFGLIIPGLFGAPHGIPVHGYIAEVEPSPQARAAWRVALEAYSGKAVPRDRQEEPCVAGLGQELILLIHGIRTQAEWQDMVAEVLGQIPNLLVWPLKYGFFDVFRFWCPFLTRRRPIGEILWRIREARRRYPDARLSVIAHSFGTYAIGMILMDNPDIMLHRLVLCGSVLPCGFRWDRIGQQVKSEVINDCGTKDIWPVVADCVSWGYGASGTYGFGTPGIYDRCHDMQHSGFFARQFVMKFWLPWFTDGRREPGTTPGRRPYWWSLMTACKVRWILPALVFLLPLLVWYFAS